MSLNKQDLIVRLKALLPELDDGRETHVQWRDCPQRYRDENPSIGDVVFHSEMVATYDIRISTVKDTLAYLENPNK